MNRLVRYMIYCFAPIIVFLFFLQLQSQSHLLQNARMPSLLGQPGDKMFWGDFESQLNHAATAKFSLASAPAIAWATSNDLGALFADPVFNLK